jgi:predicted nucleotidyltransferase
MRRDHARDRPPPLGDDLGNCRQLVPPSFHVMAMRTYTLGMDRPAIIDVASAACEEVFRGTPVFLAYAYGSRIEGGASAGSDLDIGYYLATPAAWSIAEEMTLADRLSRRLDVEVDLRNLGQAPLEWRARVLERGRRLHCTDETARVALERDVMVRWFDEQPRLRRFHEERLASFAKAGLAAEPIR